MLDSFTNYENEEPKPDSRWDYFGIGGRYEGTLPLKQPLKLNLLIFDYRGCRKVDYERAGRVRRAAMPLSAIIL